MVGGSGKDSELGAVLPNFARRQPTSSGARFEMVMPSETRNLQLKIGRAWSSSDSWQSTLQYWQSWFQQKRPYGIVSGLMNWKARSSEFRSGTRNVFPRMVISTSFSYGRKTSDIRGVPESATVAAPSCFNLPVYEAKSRRRAEQRKEFSSCSMLQWQVYSGCECGG